MEAALKQVLEAMLNKTRTVKTSYKDCERYFDFIELDEGYKSMVTVEWTLRLVT